VLQKRTTSVMAKMVAAVPPMKPAMSATWYTSCGAACVCIDLLLVGRTVKLLWGSIGWLTLLLRSMQTSVSYPVRIVSARICLRKCSSSKNILRKAPGQLDSPEACISDLRCQGSRNSKAYGSHAGMYGGRSDVPRAEPLLYSGESGSDGPLNSKWLCGQWSRAQG
jgi:hypothetical protein